MTGLTNTIERPDIVEERHNPELLLCGFEDRLDDVYIDGNQLIMFAVDLHDRRLYELKENTKDRHGGRKRNNPNNPV